MVKMNLSENICDLRWQSFQGRSIYRNGFLLSCTTFTITHSYHAQSLFLDSFVWILAGFKMLGPQKLQTFLISNGLVAPQPCEI